MDFKLRNMSNYRDFGTMTFGVIPYAIYDTVDHVLYLPDLDWFHELTNTNYQKYIDDFMTSNVEMRYNVLLMGNLKWDKINSMKLGTYKLNPTKLNTSKFDLIPYKPYFIESD